MGRGKGSGTRKDGVAVQEVGMVGRRSYMDQLPSPTPVHHALSTPPIMRPKNASKRAPSVTNLLSNCPPSKRPRTLAHASPPSHVNGASQLSKRLKPSSDPSTPQQIPRFQYAPARYLDAEKILSGAAQRTVQVHVPVEYLTISNPAIRNRQLWGYEEYTDDSDLVAILMHSGHFPLPSQKPSSFDHLEIHIQLSRHQSRTAAPFIAKDCNGLRSRAWGSIYEGARIRILFVNAVRNDRVTRLRRARTDVCYDPPYLITWRADESVGREVSAGNGKRAPQSNAPRSLQDATVCFDICNDPCLCYSLTAVCSLSVDTARWPVRRLRKEVLYVENDAARFEVALVDPDAAGKAETSAEKLSNLMVRFGKVKPQILKKLLQTSASSSDKVEDDARQMMSVPMAANELEVIEKSIPWTQLLWDSTGVTVNSKRYNLLRLSYRQRGSPTV